MPSEYLLLIFSDTHYPRQDARCIDIIHQIAADSGKKKLTKPVDEYILNGDICNLSRMSRHERDEDWSDENYSHTREMLRGDLVRIAECDPHARRIARPGNHDDNWNEYVQRVCPDVHGIMDSRGRLFSFHRWIGFDECGWGWHGSEEPLVYFHNFIVVHGDVQGCGGETAAKKLLTHFGKSGASGHTHRPHSYTSSRYKNDPIGWWVGGCMCRRDFRYLRGDAYQPKWVQGFLSVRFTQRGTFHVQHHNIIERKDKEGRVETVFQGRTYVSGGLHGNTVRAKKA